MKFKLDELKDKTTEDLKKLFESHNDKDRSALHIVLDLNNFVAQDLEKVIKTLPKSILTLLFNSNEFPENDSILEEMGKIFESLPKNINSIGMQNCLQKQKANNILQLMKRFPASVTSLDLYGNSLSQHNPKDLITIFKNLKGITSLKIGDNELSQIKLDDLEKVLGAIPENVTSLDLRTTRLSGYTSNELIRIMKGISRLSSAGLGNNSLGILTPGILINLFKEFSKITSLDLSYNELNILSSENLIALIKGIPPSVTSLDLSCNDLFKKCSLDEFSKALPPHLNSINLKGNFSDKSSYDDRIKFIQDLDKKIKKVAVDPVYRAQVDIENEIQRLKASSTNSGNVLVNIGLIKASDAKIKALELLKDILKSHPNDIDDQLVHWKITHEVSLKTQRNKVHAFFQPGHIATTQKKITEVFTLLNIFEPRQTEEQKNALR